MEDNKKLNQITRSPSGNEYLISNATVYDSDLEMWRTHIGIPNKDMALKYTAWGKTPTESRMAAQELVSLLK